MPKTWKDALYLGDWHLPKGDVFRCTEADMKHFYKRAKEMLATGAPVPWCFEHDPEIGLSASPVENAKRQAENNGGHCYDVRMGRDGQLQFLVDYEPEDLPKLKRNKFCSPELRPNVIDSHGKRWDGMSIVHLAVTPRPVQWPQKPFEFDALDTAPLSLSQAGVTISLSQANFAPPKGKTMPKPPDKPEEKPDDDLEGIGEDETPIPAPPADTPSPDSGTNDLQLMHKLSQEMAELGVMVEPTPGMDLKSYVEHLCTAIKTHKASKDTGTTEKPNEAQPPQNEPLPEIAESAPVMMSQTQIDQMKAENEQLKVSLSQTQTELSRRRKDELQAVRNEIASAYESGAFTRDYANARIAELKNVSLSSAVDPVFVRIRAELDTVKRLAAEGKIAGFQTKSSVSLSTAEEVPERLEKEDDARKRGEEAGDELAALAGAPCKKK